MKLDLDRPSVRLLQLLRGDETDDIQCNIWEARIDQSEGGLSYDALSYTWGSMALNEQITVDGSTMRVTSNLFDALKHLRLDNKDRILWIDAICINQSDANERKHQVRHMGNIYKEADHVIVWLGHSSVHSDYIMDFMKQLQDMTKKVEGDWRSLAKHFVSTRENTLGKLRDGMEWVLSC